MPGRVYTDESTVLGQDVQANFVIFRPSAASNDPAAGIFNNWPDAHAAVSLLDVPLRTIYIDAAPLVVTIPPGAWDMNRIAVVGYPTVGAPLLRQSLTTVPGTTFLNFTEGTENCALSHGGVAPLYSPSPVAPNALRIRTGKNALWTVSGPAPLVFMAGTGGLLVAVEDGTEIVTGAFQVFELVGAPGEIEFRLYDGTDLGTNTLRGPLGSTIDRLFTGVGSIPLPQPFFLGTLADFNGASKLRYSGTGPWVPPAPTEVETAISRLATALAPLVGGLIP